MLKSVTFVYTTEHGRGRALVAQFDTSEQGISVGIDVLAGMNDLTEQDIYGAEQQALDYYYENEIERQY